MSKMPMSHLPPSTRPASVSLTSRDAASMREFYGGVLGFEEIPEQSGATAFLLSPDLASRILVESDPRSVHRSPSAPGLFHLAILYPDAAALGRTLRRLIAEGYPLDGAADHLVSQAVYLRDPEENGLELYIDRPREEWPQKEGELQMGTEYLDLEPILRAGAELRPRDAGSRIGHIHLQVSNLERSGKFYQTVIGFEVTQRSFPGALFLSAGGYHHHLGINVWRSRGKPPAPANAAGLRGFRLAVPSLSAVHEVRDRAAENGIPAAPDGDRSVTIADPDGIPVTILVEGG